MLVRPRTIFDLLGILWRRKWLLIISTLIMLAASFAAIKKVPSLYEAKALIVVTNQSLPEVLQQSTSFSSVIQQQTSHDVLVPLIRRFRLYPAIKEYDFALNALRKDIKMDIKMRGYFPEGPEAVTISYRNADPDTSSMVVEQLVNNFEKANDSIKQAAADEADRLSQKISEIEGKLKQIAPEKDMALIRSQSVTRMATNAATIRAQRSNTESSIGALSDKEYGLQRQINDLQRLVIEQEKIVKTQNASTRTSNPVIGQLLIRKSELEAQIKVFQTQYTEKNPKVISVREQLNEINKQIQILESANPVTEAVSAVTPESVELKSLKKDLARLETELEVTQRELGRKKESLSSMPIYSEDYSGLSDPATVASMSESKSEYDRLLVRYNSLIDRQDSMIKLAGISGSATPMFQIVDAPLRPQHPVAPNKMILYLFGLALSITVGLIMVIIFELPNFVVLNDEQDIEYYIGAPVVALIPRTYTSEELSRHRRIRMTRSFILLIMGFCMIPVITVILQKVQVFQILGSR